MAKLLCPRGCFSLDGFLKIRCASTRERRNGLIGLIAERGGETPWGAGRSFFHWKWGRRIIMAATMSRVDHETRPSFAWRKAESQYRAPEGRYWLWVA